MFLPLGFSTIWCFLHLICFTLFLSHWMFPQIEFWPTLCIFHLMFVPHDVCPGRVLSNSLFVWLIIYPLNVWPIQCLSQPVFVQSNVGATQCLICCLSHLLFDPLKVWPTKYLSHSMFVRFNVCPKQCFSNLMFDQTNFCPTQCVSYPLFVLFNICQT